MANITHNISDKSYILVNSYIDYNNYRILKISDKMLNFDLQHVYNFNNQNELIWGLGYGQITDNVNNLDVKLKYFPSYRNNKIFSGFIQNKFVFNDKFNITLGVKTEKNTFVKNFQYQPSIKFSYYPSKNQTIWSSWSKSDV